MTTLELAVPDLAPVWSAASRKEEALWLLERMVPGTGVNNLSVAFAVEWRLDPDQLRRSLAFLLDRHEVLRPVFREERGGLVRAVLPLGQVLDVDEVELAADAVALDGFVGQPFEMDGRPLLRARLHHTERGDVFCVALHHLIFDAMSVPV